MKNSFYLMILTIIGKVLGFGRELVLTSTYGATSVSDVYIISMNIPNIICEIIGASIMTTFIPLFYEIRNECGNDRASVFTNNLFNIMIIISSIIAFLGCIFSKELVKIFAIDFDGEKLILATQLCKIMIWGIVFIVLSNLLSAYLQIKGNFNIPGIVSIPYNIIIMLSILFSFKYGIMMLGIGTLLGMVMQFLILIFFAIKEGYRYKFKLDIKDIYLLKMVKLIIPVCIGVGLNQINLIIDKSLSSTLQDGTIVILNSANKLQGFVISLFVMTIGVVIYPTLSKLGNENKLDEFKNKIQESINYVLILIMPISVGTIVLSKPIVRLIFERGKFNSLSTEMTANALVCFALGMVSLVMINILYKVFYALKDTKTPMINGSIAIIINIILNFILIKPLGYIGIAISTSIGINISMVLLFYSLGRKINNFGQKDIINTFIKCLISSIVMGIIVIFSYRFINGLIYNTFINQMITIILSIIIGVVVYAFNIFILKVKEVELAIKLLKEKLI